MSPYPGGFTECTCLVLPQCRRPSPTWKGGSASRFFPRTRFFAGRFSRLQLFRYVQASQFARLTDRSHLCSFRRRAAEAFTSELNVRRYLRTHRRCYPPDYRQLAERGLSPRKIHSIVGCSSHCSILSIFQLGYFPVGRKRERVTTRRERPCSGEEKAIRSTRQSVTTSDKSWVDMTRPHKSVSLFIAHQP